MIISNTTKILFLIDTMSLFIAGEVENSFN